MVLRPTYPMRILYSLAVWKIILHTRRRFFSLFFKFYGVHKAETHVPKDFDKDKEKHNIQVCEAMRRKELVKDGSLWSESQ
jgi:hypothetical protein